MPKTNEVTRRLFADIAKPPTELSSYYRFLSVDEELSLPVSEELKKYKNLYDVHTRDHADEIRFLASIEEIIIQIRCKEMIESELRLSLSRNYIYARSMFYRRGKEINDIRVIIGTVETYGDNLGELLKDESFRLLCYTSLVIAMKIEIEKNINQLNTVYAND